MKIFFCLKTFLPGHVAGTEIYVAALARELQLEGMEVAVIKPNYEQLMTSQYFYEKIRVIEYAESGYNDRDLQTGNKFPEGIKNFETILKDERPDIIHFQEISGSNGITIQHVRIAAAMRIRVFVTLHLVRYVCKRNTLKYMGNRECDGIIRLKKCSACLLQDRGLNSFIAGIAGTAAMAVYGLGLNLQNIPTSIGKLLNYPGYVERHRQELQELVGLSEKTILLNEWFKNILLRNGLPQDKLCVSRQAVPYSSQGTALQDRLLKEGEPLRIIYIGRICRIKGLEQLLIAFKALNPSNAILDIFGNITEEDYYLNCKKIAGLDERIRWKGVEAPAGIVSLIKKYDLLVFPTLVEEMAPFTLLDAFAAGVPVLASNVQACREEIKAGDNGWLFSPEDAKDLEEKLGFLLRNPAVLIKASQQSGKVDSFERVAAEHIRLYQLPEESIDL